MISLLRKIIFSRVSICIIGIIVQLSYLCTLFWTLGTMFSYSFFIFWIIGFCVALYIMNQDINPSYKLVWTFTVLSFPVFGCMIYWFYAQGKKSYSPFFNEKYQKHLNEDQNNYDVMYKNNERTRLANYLKKNIGFPIYTDTKTEYFQNGETVFPKVISELEKAEHYIFLEYFIIEAGLVWDTILDILLKKVKQGLDIRVLYDDMGCLLTLPRDYYKQLENNGIKCSCFGRLRPLWSAKMNNRDHRKMLIIDGKTAFTGGINLADEYVNAYKKHGYWKDSTLMLKGNGVRCFTIMFLAMWDHIRNEESNISRYVYNYCEQSQGYVIPFMDSPLDKENISENVYLNIINAAKEYVYITTPYLIIDDNLQSQLILAAKSGIDVRIITPHIPDKKIVYYATKANYNKLIKGGVRIYEFLPGFIHAKNIVSDDNTAVVGTINLDFRSLYLHYECGICLCDTESVNDIKQDILSVIESSKEISLEECKNISTPKKILQWVMKLFSPMM